MANTDTASANQIIRRKYDLLEEASRTGKIREAVTAVYSNDIITAGQDAPTVHDSGALVDVLEGLIGGGAVLKISEMFGEAQVSGDLAYSFVLNQVTPPDGGEAFEGKSLMVWRRSGDDWHCVADMFAMGGY